VNKGPAGSDLGADAVTPGGSLPAPSSPIDPRRLRLRVLKVGGQHRRRSHGRGLAARRPVGREIASRPKHRRIRRRRHDRGRPQNPDARDGLNPPAHLVGAVLGYDLGLGSSGKLDFGPRHGAGGGV
jgi:hypothetical protein